ncbi:MAG: glyoxalase/bleomycin resistance/extradiol dioxygenase family protein [Chitinophagaceae bacterium]|nr:glyoxalase/bleomycin resistance/extradiol dioxygenase family protein [Chitinophagaceae bacterium]
MSTIKSIYINLPVKDLAVTKAFWTSLGFGFNDQFTDEKAACLVLNEGSMYAMLITHEFFSTFTNRPIADGSSTQVLLAVEVESREKVDSILQAAIANGGSRYRESADHGWMYYDSFGHQWEVMYTDPTKLPS